MAMPKGQNTNHPKKGASIKVDPIRDLATIQRIKRNLIDQGKMRDYCLFTLGVNTAWRANELLSLRVGDVAHLKAGDILELKQSKTRAYRKVLLNDTAHRAIEFWLALYNAKDEKQPLFCSPRGGALCVPTLTALVKRWCFDAGAMGKFGSHSLRKSWGYHQRVTFETPTVLITQAFGHSTERQTLDYLGIQAIEINGLYWNEI